ncbi:Mitogen-activated protein kinase kinase kinase A, partial [Diplonema papillatum]
IGEWRFLRHPAKWPAGYFARKFTHCKMKYSITFIVAATTLISTGASLAGGLVMYFESLKSLSDTVEEISAAQTDVLARQLNQSYWVPQNHTASMIRFVENYDFRDAGPAQVEDFMKWWAFSMVQSSSDLTELGVICDMNNLTSSNIENFQYYHVWYDLDTDGIKRYVLAVHNYHNYPDKPMVAVRALHPVSGNPSSIPEYDFDYSEPTEERLEAAFLGKMNTGSWRYPQKWKGHGSRAAPYIFETYDVLRPPPADPTHPFSICSSILYSGYFMPSQWKLQIAPHKEKYPDDTVVVVDAEFNWVYASSTIGQNSTTGEVLIDPDCDERELSGHRSPDDDECVLRIAGLKDAPAREAALFLLKKRKMNPNGDPFFQQTVGGQKSFIRWKDVHTSESVDAVTGEKTIRFDAVIIWIRSASVVQGKVDQALLFLGIFVAIVFAVDVFIAFAEILIIARPLAKLSHAIAIVGNIENLESAVHLRSTIGSLYISEMDTICVAFDMMTTWLFVYRPFIPECVRRATGKDFEDQRTGTNPLEGDPTFDSSMNTSHRDQVASFAATQRSETLEVVDMTTATPTGLQATVGSPAPSRRSLVCGNVSFSSASSFGNDNDAVASNLQSIQTHAKYVMLQGRERTLRSRLATLVLAELDVSKGIDGKRLATFVEGVLDVGRKFESVTLQVVGNSVLLAWNTHVPYPLHTQRGADCALAMSDMLGRERARLQDSWWTIAIVRGSVQIGIIGAERHRASVVIGEPMSLVSSLAALGRRLKVRVVASAEIFEKVRSLVTGRPIDVIALPPDPECNAIGTTTVYELFSGNYPEDQRQLFIDAFSAITDNRWQKAAADLASCIVARPQDRQALRLLRVSLKPPKETFRRYLGWSRPEEGAQLVELPADVMQAIENYNDGDVGGAESIQVATADVMTVQAPGRLWEGFVRGNMGRMNNKRPPAIFETVVKMGRRNRWQRSCKQIGVGGYGEVTLGMEGDEGSLAAFKIVRLPSVPALNAANAEQRIRKQVDELQREVDLLDGLRHTNVVSYLGSAVCDGHVIIVMEYVSGGSLDGIIRDFGQLALPVVKKYMGDILNGLAFLHSMNIVHRDLKPHNVLITPDGLCKLADFGAAATLAKLNGDGFSKIMGTPLYMAPEACRAEVQFESDIWAAGIVLVELATGEIHCVWASHIALTGFQPKAFTSMLALNESMLPDIPRDLPADLVSFVGLCFQRDPAQRPSAARLKNMPFLLG